jgi:hypothetical protein
MATPRLSTQQGRLTAYAFACGYYESVKHGKFSIKLQLVNGSYRFSVWDCDNGAEVILCRYTHLQPARRRWIAACRWYAYMDKTYSDFIAT